MHLSVIDLPTRATVGVGVEYEIAGRLLGAGEAGGNRKIHF